MLVTGEVLVTVWDKEGGMTVVGWHWRMLAGSLDFTQLMGLGVEGQQRTSAQLRATAPREVSSSRIL